MDEVMAEAKAYVLGVMASQPPPPPGAGADLRDALAEHHRFMNDIFLPALAAIGKTPKA